MLYNNRFNGKGSIMRISVFPKGEMDAIVAGQMTVFDWLDQVKDLQIEGVELYSGFFSGKGDAFVDRVAAAITDRGLEMPMLCASPDLTHPDPVVRKAEVQNELRMMEITHRISGSGASTRILTGQRHPGVSIDEGIGWFFEALDELLPVARDLDILLGIENHYKDGSWTYPEFAQRAEVFHALLDRAHERVHFGVQFDPSNAITSGEESADFLDTVIDRVYTMQASDRSVAPGSSLDELRLSDGTIGYSPLLHHGIIGQGLNDYPRIFRSLVAAGYDGWISIEDGVNGIDELRASVDYLVTARDKYFGSSTAVRVETLERERKAVGLPSWARPNLEEER